LTTRPYLTRTDIGGGSVTEKEHEGVELLLRDPEIVAWLELDDAESEDEET
jgi:hypothetical protein